MSHKDKGKTVLGATERWLQSLTYNHILDILLTRGGTALMPTLVLVQRDPSYYLTHGKVEHLNTP